jgi:hypothetical protein
MQYQDSLDHGVEPNYFGSRVRFPKLAIFSYDVLQHRCDVLADVVVASAFPEIFGIPVVEIQRHVGDFVQVLRVQFHVRWTKSRFSWMQYP